MPWAETDPMNERLHFINAYFKRSSTFRSLCAAFGVAPKTGYKWLHQFEELGAPGLRDRSRRPKSNPRTVADDIGDRLQALRLEHPTWGPKKLVAWLEANEAGWKLPAPSTVGELLKKRGLVKPRGRWRHQRPRTEPLRHADAPNVLWAMDHKGWFRLGDGNRCDPLTITDAFSRYLICCQVGSKLGDDRLTRDVWSALVEAFQEYGIPNAIRVDNGVPWVAPNGEVGISALAVKIMKVGVALERIRPGKPQENGRHERFHLTLHRETASPPCLNMRAQQRRFDAFRHEYNHVRPHEALEQRTPSSVYVPSPRPFPTRVEDPEYPRWYEVAKPAKGGFVTFHGERYFISTVLAGERVGFVEVEESCFEVYFGRLLLGRIHTGHPELGFIAA